MFAESSARRPREPRPACALPASDGQHHERLNPRSPQHPVRWLGSGGSGLDWTFVCRAHLFGRDAGLLAWVRSRTEATGRARGRWAEALWMFAESRANAAPPRARTRSGRWLTRALRGRIESAIITDVGAASASAPPDSPANAYALPGERSPRSDDPRGGMSDPFPTVHSSAG